MKVCNPIIPGFAPDPSIVLVNGTYYLVNSSFHLFPGLPIYTSKDLVQWTLINHAISRPSQLSLDHAWMMHIKIPQPPDLIITGGLFAPTIRYHKKVFYIVCTNAIEDSVTKAHSFQNFLLSCPEDRILTPDSWLDPIYFDFPGIDPSLFFDNDRAYIQGSYREGPPWAPDCSIRQFEIDLETGKSLSETRLLWKGCNPKGDAEGPHMYKKDDWYYLVTAEGSTFEGHEINIARSQNIWGPFESHNQNPLLSAKGSAEQVQWTGHGDLFQAMDGSWLCVHLGVRKRSPGSSRYPLGRETFLTPVSWDAGKWPEIIQTKLQYEIANKKHEVNCEQTGSCLSPQRATTRARTEDIFIRTPQLDDYKNNAQNAYHLRPRTSNLSSSYGTTTFIGRRQRSLDCSATCSLDLSSVVSGCSRAGLTVYKDSLRHAEIFYEAEKQQVRFSVDCLDKLELSERIEIAVALEVSDAKIVKFRIDCREGEGKYVFYWTLKDMMSDSGIWQELAAVDMAHLSAHDMTGAIFGLFADGFEQEQLDECWVSFPSFQLSHRHAGS